MRCELHEKMTCEVYLSAHLAAMMPRHRFDLCSLPSQQFVLLLLHSSTTVCCPQRDLQFLLQQTHWSKRSQIVLGNVLSISVLAFSYRIRFNTASTLSRCHFSSRACLPPALAERVEPLMTNNCSLARLNFPTK